MNYAEQIAAFEARRAATVAANVKMMDDAGKEGTTLDQEQSDAFDANDAEVAEIDKHLARLRTVERAALAKAAPITTQTVESGAARGGPAIIIKGDAPDSFEGQSFTRMVIAKALARLDDTTPAHVAMQRWNKSNPALVQHIIAKAAVPGGGAGSGEWGAELVTMDGRYTGDFIDFLYSKTIYDQLPLREIPANVTIKGQDGAATGYWVGESAAIPVSKPDYMNVSLTPLKVAALAVVSKELLRDSSPAAEALVRDALVQASSQRVDFTFLSATAAAAGVSPAGMLFGLTAGTSAGTGIAGVIADVKALYATFISQNNASGLHFVTTETLGKSLGLMQNALGNFAFPTVDANGGALLGDPVHTGGNVGVGDLILLKPSDIYKIGDRGIEVSLSDVASIEMSDAPAARSDTPTGTTTNGTVSMFQTESVAFKVVRSINFAKRRASAVAYIGDAAYT